MIELDCNKKAFDFARENANFDSFIEFYGGIIKYGKFFELIDRLSYNLIEYGIKKDEVVTVALPNCPQLAMLVYALSNIGAVASLISPLIAEKQILEVMARTSSKRLFISTITAGEFNSVEKIRVDFSHFAGFVQRMYLSKQRIATDGTSFEKVFLKKNKRVRALPDVNPNRTAFLLNSGGTTGNPKTVMLSQVAVNTSAFYIINNLDENGYTLPVEANALYILPMFYGYGLSVFHTQISSSFNQFVRTKFRPKDIVKDLAKHDVEVMFGVPVMFKKMLSTGMFNGELLPKFSVCYSGGEKLALSLQAEFKKAFPYSVILEGYGLSEAVAAFVSQSRVYFKEGSCGKIFGPIKIEAFDNETELPRDTDGEICVCTRSMMNGYYNDSVNTDKVIFDYNGEKWLRTGDYGRVDSEGYVFLSSRIKNIIKRKGVKIFPSQIEACIGELDFIKDVVVFGYTDKQDVERIASAVVLKDNSVADVQEKIKEYVKDKLSVLSCPEYILIEDKLMLTAVGKVNTLLLKDKIKNKFESSDSEK